ncbi:MAG: hypothetical protein AABY27_00080 [Pseudomonadota bacterium]
MSKSRGKKNSKQKPKLLVILDNLEAWVVDLGLERRGFTNGEENELGAIKIPTLIAKKTLQNRINFYQNDKDITYNREALYAELTNESVKQSKLIYDYIGDYIDVIKDDEDPLKVLTGAIVNAIPLTDDDREELREEVYKALKAAKGEMDAKEFIDQYHENLGAYSRTPTLQASVLSKEAQEFTFNYIDPAPGKKATMLIEGVSYELYPVRTDAGVIFIYPHDNTPYIQETLQEDGTYSYAIINSNNNLHTSYSIKIPYVFDDGRYSEYNYEELTFDSNGEVRHTVYGFGSNQVNRDEHPFDMEQMLSEELENLNQRERSSPNNIEHDFEHDDEIEILLAKRKWLIEAILEEKRKQRELEGRLKELELKERELLLQNSKVRHTEALAEVSSDSSLHNGIHSKRNNNQQNVVNKSGGNRSNLNSDTGSKYDNSLDGEDSDDSQSLNSDNSSNTSNSFSDTSLRGYEEDSDQGSQNNNNNKKKANIKNHIPFPNEQNSDDYNNNNNNLNLNTIENLNLINNNDLGSEGFNDNQSFNSDNSSITLNSIYDTSSNNENNNNNTIRTLNITDNNQSNSIQNSSDNTIENNNNSSFNTDNYNNNNNIIIDEIGGTGDNSSGDINNNNNDSTSNQNVNNKQQQLEKNQRQLEEDKLLRLNKLLEERNKLLGKISDEESDEEVESIKAKLLQLEQANALLREQPLLPNAPTRHPNLINGNNIGDGRGDEKHGGNGKTGNSDANGSDNNNSGALDNALLLRLQQENAALRGEINSNKLNKEFQGIHKDLEALINKINEGNKGEGDEERLQKLKEELAEFARKDFKSIGIVDADAEALRQKIEELRNKILEFEEKQKKLDHWSNLSTKWPEAIKQKLELLEKSIEASEAKKNELMQEIADICAKMLKVGVQEGGVIQGIDKFAKEKEIKWIGAEANKVPEKVFLKQADIERARELYNAINEFTINDDKGKPKAVFNFTGEKGRPYENLIEFSELIRKINRASIGDSSPTEEKRQEFMSEVLDGVINNWKKFHGLATELERRKKEEIAQAKNYIKALESLTYDNLVAIKNLKNKETVTIDGMSFNSGDAQLLKSITIPSLEGLGGDVDKFKEKFVNEAKKVLVNEDAIRQLKERLVIDAKNALYKAKNNQIETIEKTLKAEGEKLGISDVAEKNVKALLDIVDLAAQSSNATIPNIPKDNRCAISYGNNIVITPKSSGNNTVATNLLADQLKKTKKLIDEKGERAQKQAPKKKTTEVPTINEQISINLNNSFINNTYIQGWVTDAQTNNPQYQEYLETAIIKQLGEQLIIINQLQEGLKDDKQECQNLDKLIDRILTVNIQAVIDPNNEMASGDQNIKIRIDGKIKGLKNAILANMKNPEYVKGVLQKENDNNNAKASLKAKLQALGVKEDDIKFEGESVIVSNQQTNDLQLNEGERIVAHMIYQKCLNNSWDFQNLSDSNFRQLARVFHPDKKVNTTQLFQDFGNFVAKYNGLASEERRLLITYPTSPLNTTAISNQKKNFAGNNVNNLISDADGNEKTPYITPSNNGRGGQGQNL